MQFNGQESSLITMCNLNYISDYHYTRTVHLNGMTTHWLIDLDTKHSQIINKGDWVVFYNDQHFIVNNHYFKKHYYLLSEKNNCYRYINQFKPIQESSDYMSVGYIIKVGNQYISEKNYFKDNYEISWGVKLSNNQGDTLVFNDYNEAEKYAQFCNGKVGTVSLENK